MPDVVAVSSILYRLISCNAAISEEDIRNCIHSILSKLSGEYSSRAPIDSQIIAASLRHHQNLFRIVDRWRTHFRDGNLMQESQAHDFIRDVLNSTKDIDAWYAKSKDDIMVGSNVREIDAYTDIETCPSKNRFDWMIPFTCEGIGSYSKGVDSTISATGDIVMLAPGANMRIRRDSGCKRWQYFYMHFPFRNDYLNLLQWPEVALGVFRLSLPDGGKREQMSVLFENAMEASDSKLPLSKELLQNILGEILIRCRQVALLYETSHIDRRIAGAANFIREFADHPISIQDISGKVGLSGSRLNALFKRQIGASPLQWRDSQRMLRACQLLAGGHRSLSQIAEAVGYNDAHYFSRCFRRHMGCTPSHYRKENGRLFES